MYSLKSRNSASSPMSGGNAKSYSNTKISNPYNISKEDCAGREVTKKVVAAGEEFLFMADKMTAADAQYALAYPYGAMNGQFNTIKNHADGNPIKQVDVTVHETELGNDFKTTIAHNIKVLMQAKGLDADPNFTINFRFQELENTEEMDGEGKIEMNFKYTTCKQ